MPASTGPIGIVALGHSGLTGFASDPFRPEGDARENSWATGTSPEVNSVYQRLVAVRPETEGHVANTARDGAAAATLATQAEAALKLVPASQLVIIQTIDNDIRCDGTDDQHVGEFGSLIADALQVITAPRRRWRPTLLQSWQTPARGCATSSMNPVTLSKSTSPR